MMRGRGGRIRGRVAMEACHAATRRAGKEDIAEGWSVEGVHAYTITQREEDGPWWWPMKKQQPW